ncbi:MAG: hypothetical protein GC185_09530 [Alphaproteobacteria bacterium]|nr:hypothetical protein [Alphaproteobacteria bacterium]
MVWFFKKKELPPPPPTRHDLDEKQLAEYLAFDEAVGGTPTQETLRDRFTAAVLAGHTQVAADTLAKGLENAGDVTREGRGLFSGNTNHAPLQIASEKEWLDMVEVLLNSADEKSLKTALYEAEKRRNVDIGKAIRQEMIRRNEGHMPKI